MYGMDPRYLTAKDIKKLEEGMNTEDLEMMIAIVDQIVERHLKTPEPMNVDAKIENADWLKRRGKPVTKPTKKQEPRR